MTPECDKLWDEISRRFDYSLWHRPKSALGVSLHNKLKTHLNLDRIYTGDSNFILSLRLRYWGCIYQSHFEQPPPEALIQDKLVELKHDFENSQK